MSVLAKYDIRGIQSFIFSTDKLREIKAVQDLPEKILFQALINSANVNAEQSEEDILDELKKNGIDVLDKNGGNAYVIYDTEEHYKTISKAMALYIVQNTYSLRLVYGCVENTNNFKKDYDTLNKKVGAIKSVTPGKLHIGAPSICKQDRKTGHAFIKIDDRGDLRTTESVKKLGYFKRGGQKIDDLTAEENSIIAIIHIDGNNMGQRINTLVERAGSDYEDARSILGRISVKKAFGEVCDEIKAEAKQLFGDEWNKKYIYALIQAGDDITYITRGDIALSFTKRFLEMTHKKYMCDDKLVNSDPSYLISACAGIAYCHSHFPFSEGYELAEKLCSSAKVRAKANKSESGFIGSWIDFERCESIHSIELADSRKQYRNINATDLIMRPFCVAHQNYKNDQYDINIFINMLEKMNDVSETSDKLTRSDWKELREAYFDGKTAVDILGSRLESRGKKVPKLYADVDGKTYAAVYDAIEIMDLYKPFAKDDDKEVTQ